MLLIQTSTVCRYLNSLTDEIDDLKHISYNDISTWELSALCTTSPFADLIGFYHRLHRRSRKPVISMNTLEKIGRSSVLLHTRICDHSRDFSMFIDWIGSFN